MIRSLYAKILLGFAAIFVLAVASFLATMAFLASQKRGPSEFLSRTAEWHLSLAEEAFREGGPTRLAQFRDRLNEAFQVEHYFVDPRGRDLIDGGDRADLLRRSRRSPFLPPDRKFVFSKWSADGQHGLLVVAPPPGTPSDLLYFFWIPVAVTLACFLLAYQLIKPLRRVRDVVARFGRGELAARVGLTRRDEIGQVAVEFDRMAERIEHLVLAERRLLQDVSHELRSPLARLAFAAELAETGDQPSLAFARVRKEIQRLTDLVSELLELTRAEGDPAAAVRAPFLLDEVIHEAVADCGGDVIPGDRQIETRLVKGVRVRGHAALLRRAIENVLENALRFAPEHSVIAVGLAASEGTAIVTVRDHGPGVPEDLLEAIFKPFFRVETDRNRTAGGIGLGLSIARRAVTVCGGQITARNGQPGLEVRIELPCP